MAAAAASSRQLVVAVSSRNLFVPYTNEVSLFDETDSKEVSSFDETVIYNSFTHLLNNSYSKKKYDFHFI